MIVEPQEVSHKLPIHSQFWHKPTDVTHVIASLRHCFRVVSAQLPIYAATVDLYLNRRL